jgi:hypothetical protein
MSARDELAAVIVEAYGESPDECPCEQDLDVADAILAAGYRKPRTITTVAELDVLGLESVVKAVDGNVWECLVGGWFETASRACHVASDLLLPVTVLYEPSAE